MPARHPLERLLRFPLSLPLALALALLLPFIVSAGAARESVSPGRANHAPATSDRHPSRHAWTVVWSDDFIGPAGAAPDTTVWRFDVGDGCTAGICGWGNEEKEWYTTDRANSALTGNGELAITARIAPAGLTCYYGPCRYTSAKLKTAGRVEAGFGRVEARIRLPRGQGLWPAFWMLGASFPATPWPASGELDIMEFRGSRPFETSSAMHGPGYSGSSTPFVHRHAPPGADFSAGFHRYAVEWDPAEARFYVDDDLHYRVTRGQVRAHGPWAFDQPFYVILNLAVGGGFDGDPASDAVLPATMLVDYVRVYARAP